MAHHKEELREEMGDEYTELKAYIRVHQKKKGAYPNNFTKDICDKVGQQCSIMDISQSKESTALVPALDAVFGRHYGRYERGIGTGWSRQLMCDTPKHHAPHNAMKNLQDALSKSLECNEALMKRNEALVTRNELLEARLQHLEVLYDMDSSWERRSMPFQ